MNDKESQQQINDREWTNQENWSGSKWLGVYFAKLDTRLFVPKRSFPALGWTINLGHPKGAKLFYSVAIFIPVFMMVLCCLVFAGLSSIMMTRCSASNITVGSESDSPRIQQNFSKNNSR